MVEAGYCPKDDFARDSVQSRVLNFSGKTAKKAFIKQEEMRLQGGFEQARRYFFGDN